MKKILSLILCAAMLAAFAVPAAIADDRVPAEYVSTGALQYDTTAEVNNGEAMKLDFWVQTEVSAFYQKWTDAYTALHPNITFELTEGSYDDHFTKLGLALQSGSGPQLFHMHNAFSDQLVGNMKPYDPDVIPLDKLREDYEQIDEHLINGQIYYIGLGFMTSGIYYNKTLWADAGLTDADIPATWDQLVAVAKKLTKTDENGTITTAGFNYNEIGMQYMITALNYQKGVAMFEKDSRVPVFNDVFLDNLKWLQNLYTVEKIGSATMPMSLVSFSEGTTAMIYGWDWIGNWFNQNAPDMDYGFFQLPTWDGEVPAAYDRCNTESSLGINANVTDAEYAVINDFVLYLLSNDNADLDFAMDLYTAPAKKSIADAELIANDVVLSTSAKVLDRTINPGAFPDSYYDTLNSVLFEGVVLNGDDPAEAMEQCRDEVTDNLDGSDYVSTETMYSHADELTFQ